MTRDSAQHPRAGRGTRLGGGDASQLPAFAFPVMAWAPEPATGDIGDDGIREFRTPGDVATTYMPESDLRLGWTFVDVEGRCWEVVSSQVIDSAYPSWTRATHGWIGEPRYRLALEFAERPPMAFDAVKSRLFAAVKANAQFYRFDRRGRLQELRDAQSLRDLIKTEDELAAEREAHAIARLSSQALWWQWLFWEGRCSRRSFLAGFVVVCTAIWLVVDVLKLQMPMFLIILIGCLVLGMSMVVRRLHDLRLSAWWTALWFVWSFLCGSIHDLARDTGGPIVAGWLWWISNVFIFGCLALWPGTRGPNRYGHSRQGARQIAGGTARA